MKKLINLLLIVVFVGVVLPSGWTVLAQDAAPVVPAEVPTDTPVPPTETPVPPADTPTEVVPPAEAPAEVPTDTPVPPADTPTEVVPPADTPTEIPPVEQPTEVPPADTPTEIPPVEQPTEVPPVEQPTEVPPVEQPTEVPPVEQPTEVPPVEQPTEAVQPTVELPTETVTPTVELPTPTFTPEITVTPEITITPTITSVEISHIVVRDASDGLGEQVFTHTMTVSDTFTVYAAAYDTEGNYLKDVLANWSTTGTLDPVAATDVISFTFVPQQADTSGTIVADAGNGHIDATDIISVTAVARGRVSEQAAASALYTNKIIVANPGGSTATYGMKFYRDNGDPAISYSPGPLNPHGSAVVNLADVTAVPSNFRGSAVIESDTGLTAATIEVPTTGSGNVMAYAGVAAGAPRVFAPNVTRTFSAGKGIGMTTIIAVQNVSTGVVHVTIDFYMLPPIGPMVLFQDTADIQPNYAKFFNPTDYTTLQIPDNSYGAAVIQATGGNIVAAVNGMATTSDAAFAYNCPSQGYDTLYVPTWQRAEGPQKWTSYVAVQNPSLTESIFARAEYFDNNGTKVGEASAAIPPMEKRPLGPVTAGTKSGIYGSAVVRGYASSIDLTPKEIVATCTTQQPSGKAWLSYTAVDQGDAKHLSSPYARWTTTAGQYKTYQACQNTGSANTNITFTFYNRDGSIPPTGGVQTISNVLPGRRALVRIDKTISTSFDGSLEITSDSEPIQALIQVASPDEIYRDAYVGIPVAP